MKSFCFRLRCSPVTRYCVCVQPERYSNRLLLPNVVHYQSCGPTVLTCWPYKHRRDRIKRFGSLRMGTKGLLHIDEYLYENEQYNHRCGEWDIGPDPCYWHGLEQHLIQKHQTGFHSVVICYHRHIYYEYDN